MTDSTWAPFVEDLLGSCFRNTTCFPEENDYDLELRWPTDGAAIRLHDIDTGHGVLFSANNRVEVKSRQRACIRKLRYSHPTLPQTNQRSSGMDSRLGLVFRRSSSTLFCSSRIRTFLFVIDHQYPRETFANCSA